MLLQLFNEINCRKIRNELNVFEGLMAAPMFTIIWFGTVLVQVVIVHGGGYALSCHMDGLTWQQWLICIAIGGACMLWRLLILPVPDSIFGRLVKDSKVGAEADLMDGAPEQQGSNLALAIRRQSIDGSKRHSQQSLDGSKLAG